MNNDYTSKGFQFIAPFASAGDVKKQMTTASGKYTASVPRAEEAETTGKLHSSTNG